MGAVAWSMLRLALAIALSAAFTTLATPGFRLQPDDGLVDWQFALGNPDESLQEDAARMPASTEAVRIPHRLHHPNRSLWYERDLVAPAGSALHVDADDGAQVFVDGMHLANYRRWFFVPDSAAPARHVVVRVLNNAMQGGLRSVRLVPASSVIREPLDVDRPAEGFAPVEAGAFVSRMPAPQEPCRFSAWADSQGGWTTFGKLVALMAARHPHFSVGVGDLVDDGSDPRAWRSFLSALAPLAARAPVIPVAGNHDYDGYYNDLRPAHYLDLFRPDGASWFAWSCGAARFVAIDVNAEFPIGISPSSAQHRWLRAEVAGAAWTRARWRVLLVHQPPWSRSWAGYDGDEAVRVIVASLAAQGVDVVIAGHSHAFERLTRTVNGRTIHVVITGGAGGGLEQPLRETPSGSGTIILKHHFVAAVVTSEAMAFDAVDAGGQSIDRWRMTK